MIQFKSLVCLAVIASLSGCKSSNTSKPEDPNNPDVPHVPGTPDTPHIPNAPERPSMPIDGSVHLLEVNPIKTSGEEGNAAQAEFIWDTEGLKDTLGVTYQICEKNITQPYNCDVIGEVVDANTGSAVIKGSIDALTREYFILASKMGVFLTSNEESFDSEEVNQLINHIKASNADADDFFGESVSISSDGLTLAVGSRFERSSATGINGDQDNNDNFAAGAVYLYRFNGESWVQQAYLKGSNTEAGDHFGTSVSLSDDGNTLAVGAHRESSNATGVNRDEQNNLAPNAGAVYVYRFDGINWEQEGYIKASNSEENDHFGQSVALSGDGDRLAIGAPGENSAATGVNGHSANNGATDAGAAYLFEFNADGVWKQQAYIKASNTDESDAFGHNVVLSNDGNTLAVAAIGEASIAEGINGDEANNEGEKAGAVYVFRFGYRWTQEAYLKASNASAEDGFGSSISLSDDGNTLAIGARGECSSETGINGAEYDNSMGNAGAVYLFRFDNDWSQQAYIKASNTDENAAFGNSVALSDDGNVLSVGASSEKSNATGVNGDQSDQSLEFAGAVYLFNFDGDWSQKSYIKPHNTDNNYQFGLSVSLNGDGSKLAVGAVGETSTAAGINPDHTDDTAKSVGAVYLY